jgi:hypothetical protein
MKGFVSGFATAALLAVALILSTHTPSAEAAHRNISPNYELLSYIKIQTTSEFAPTVPEIQADILNGLADDPQSANWTGYTVSVFEEQSTGSFEQKK